MKRCHIPDIFAAACHATLTSYCDLLKRRRSLSERRGGRRTGRDVKGVTGCCSARQTGRLGTQEEIATDAQRLGNTVEPIVTHAGKAL